MQKNFDSEKTIGEKSAAAIVHFVPTPTYFTPLLFSTVK